MLFHLAACIAEPQAGVEARPGPEVEIDVNQPACTAAAATDPGGVHSYEGAAVGRVYVFNGGADEFGPEADWILDPGGSEGNENLQSARPAGDVNGDGCADLVVGAKMDRWGYTGNVSIWHGSSAGVSPEPAWIVVGPSGAEGYVVSTGEGAGDVNGDGMDDVVVRSSTYDFLYFGSTEGLSSEPAWSVKGRIYTIGDVNGDGLGDVVVGDRVGDDVDVGVYLGTSTGLDADAIVAAGVGRCNLASGCHLARAGDVNGDGFDDVLAAGDDTQVQLLLGSEQGLVTPPAWTASSDEEYSRFGDYFGAAGDLNGDGYADIVIGDVNGGDDAFKPGRAWVWLGAPDGPAAAADWMTDADQDHAYFGSYLGSAGDIQGDGFGDLAVVAVYYGR